MQAFTNTVETKKIAVARAVAHEKADNFRQTYFWKENLGKGCSVGCMVHEYREKNDGNIDWHSATESLYGIPRQLSFLQGRIFEGLSEEDSKKWTVRFFKSIPVGADLALVTSKLMLWLLQDKEGILKHALPDGLEVIKAVADLYILRIAGNEPTRAQWLKVRDDAYEVRRKTWNAADAAAADAYAAYASAAAAADVADAYAAYAAAASAAAAAYAAYAAAAAAAAAAADAARKKYWKRISDALIDILKSS